MSSEASYPASCWRALLPSKVTPSDLYEQQQQQEAPEGADGRGE